MFHLRSLRRRKSSRKRHTRHESWDGLRVAFDVEDGTGRAVLPPGEEPGPSRSSMGGHLHGDGEDSDDLDDEVEHWRKLEHIRSMTQPIETKRQAR